MLASCLTEVLKWFLETLKLKTIHKCFLCPYKRQSSVLCFIAFSFSRTPVKSQCTMQVKRAIWGLYYINYQYITNTCTCVEFPHYFAWIVVCFPIVEKVLHGFDHYIYCFTCAVNVPVLLTMHWSVALSSAFYRDRENIYE